ncbi:hypothetical protein SPFM1_00071 [Salmonella phage SPFM1]|nr:hypothetical protein SPFM1_00071 [Salmonella phage SPFM1]
MARIVRDTAIQGGKVESENWLTLSSRVTTLRGPVSFETMVKQYFKEGTILYIVAPVKKSLRN